MQELERQKNILVICHQVRVVDHTRGSVAIPTTRTYIHTYTYVRTYGRVLV